MIKNAIVTGLTALLALSGAVQAQDNRIDTIRSDAPELAPYGKLNVGVKTLKLVNPQGSRTSSSSRPASPCPCMTGL